MFDHRSTSRIDWPCAVLVAGLWLVFGFEAVMAIVAGRAGQWSFAVGLSLGALATLGFCWGAMCTLIVRPYAGDWRTGMGS